MSGSQNAMRDPIISAVAADARADRNRREIAVSPERVTIRRRLSGIDMRVTLPVSDYRGVALCLRPVSDGSEHLVYQLLLVHRDEDLSVLLDEAADDQNIVADWKLWARVLGMPALVERELGQYSRAGAVDGVETVSNCVRRGRPVKHRPKFLARRRLGGPIDDMEIHAEEREIIARD